MYSSEHTWDLRLTNGSSRRLPALSRGQWQISQDDAGRVYRNVNDSPLYVDYTPSRYFLRNPNVVRTRGLYELLIEQTDATVFPVRPTRGVNRGYRDPGPLFRADGSSTVIQGAGTPTIYRGDRYPKDLWGNAFITDSPTNLVHRFDRHRRRHGPTDGEERLRPRRVPRVVGRAVPAGESVLRARRHDVRRRHVPRRRAGRWPVDRVPHRLHQVARPPSCRWATDASGASSTAPARRRAVRSRRSRRRHPTSSCRRCRIRTAGGAIRRSGCSSSGGRRRSCPRSSVWRRRRPTGGRGSTRCGRSIGLDAIEPASVEKALGDRVGRRARGRGSTRRTLVDGAGSPVAAPVLKLATTRAGRCGGSSRPRSARCQGSARLR